MNHKLNIQQGVIDSYNLEVIESYIDSITPGLKEHTVDRLYEVVAQRFNAYIERCSPYPQIVNKKIKEKYKSMIDGCLFTAREINRFEYAKKNNKNLFVPYTFDYKIDEGFKLIRNKKKIEMLPEFELEKLHRVIQRKCFQEESNYNFMVSKSQEVPTAINVMVEETQTSKISYFEITKSNIKVLKGMFCYSKKSAQRGMMAALNSILASHSENKVGNTDSSPLQRESTKENYSIKIASSFDKYPSPRKLIGPYKPRRNYWGNLYEEDTIKEEKITPNDNYFYSKDNDNHDFYYYHDDNYE